MTKKSEKEMKLKEVYKLVLIGPKEEILGVHESNTEPAEWKIVELIQHHQEKYQKRVSVKVEKRLILA